jgi:predicted anti-sigma-YlaC factor YlaD
MHCHDLHTLLQHYVDGSLEPAQVARLENHLATCDGCRTGLARLRTVEQALESWPLVLEPADLTARVMAQVKSHPRTPPFRLRWTDLLLSVAGAGVMAGTGLAVTALWLWCLRPSIDLSYSLQQTIDAVRLQVLPLEMLQLELSLALQSLAESPVLLWTPLLASMVAILVLISLMWRRIPRRRRNLA